MPLADHVQIPRPERRAFAEVSEKFPIAVGESSLEPLDNLENALDDVPRLASRDDHAGMDGFV
jgi:hypothetical protein